MYIYEQNDLVFLIKSLTHVLLENFDIKDFISVNTSNTRSGSHLKLCHPRALSTNHHHFYFNRIVRLWNHMPVIDISLPNSKTSQIFNGTNSQLILILTNLIHATTSVHATDVQDSQPHPTSSIYSLQLTLTSIIVTRFRKISLNVTLKYEELHNLFGQQQRITELLKLFLINFW